MFILVFSLFHFWGIKETLAADKYPAGAGPTVGANEQCSVCVQQKVKALRRTMVTSEHYVYLDDSLKLEPARLPTRSLTAELIAKVTQRLIRTLDSQAGIFVCVG